MKNDRKFAILTVYLLFLMTVSAPLWLILEDESVLIIGYGILKILVAVSFLLYCRFSKPGLLKNTKLAKKSLLLLPFLAAIANNLLFMQLLHLPVSFEASPIFPDMIDAAGAALLEEIVFRGLIYGYLREEEKNDRYHIFRSMLAVSLLFAVSHLLNALTIGIGPALLQAGYTFFTGLLFVFIYQYSNNLTLAIAAHFLYNTCNEILFSKFSGNMNEQMIMYSIVNITILTVYGILLFRKT